MQSTDGKTKAVESILLWNLILSLKVWVHGAKFTLRLAEEEIF